MHFAEAQAKLQKVHQLSEKAQQLDEAANLSEHLADLEPDDQNTDIYASMIKDHLEEKAKLESQCYMRLVMHVLQTNLHHH